ncbi:hypothetical protein XENOCAPTIV_004119, partial [Xenoophorus captivus]
PCMTIFPPCLSEADRYSLEALRSIHQMMDDDQDGGIEVEESMEVQTVRGALKQAEKEMIASWTVSGALQQWLQLTHEVEVQHALSDVTACLRERLHRWQHIEHLCGFPIMRNPGLANLTAQLYSDSAPLGFPRVSQSSCSCHSSVHGSIEDLLHEPAVPIARQMPGPIPPLKRSPHLRGSTICRAHRPGVIPQSQPAMNSPDPDLLIPTRASYSCYDDGGDLLRKTLKKQQRSDVSMDVALRKGISHDLDMEVLPTKTEKDTLEDSMDVPSRNLYKERYDVDPLEMKKILRPELEASTETHRIILRDTMETSINGASRKKMRDDAERLIESRRITRNSIGMSQDIASRNLPLNTGDYQHESSLIVIPKDKISETAGIPQRKISRDELEYYTDTASIKMHPRETMDAYKDTSNFKDTPEFGLESSKSRGILRNEAEMSVGSVRRRLPGIPRSDTSLTDTFTENISRERINAPTDMPKNLTLRNDFGGFESGSLQCRIGQPDLMPTSQVPWQSSSDLCTAGPLSQLVYDGILEKSCSSLSSVQTPLSASSPNLPQSKLPAELESPLPPPKVVYPSLASAPESGDDKNKAKDKSKKSLKLKNLFKKKNESTPEKSHSGLQKL